MKSASEARGSRPYRMRKRAESAAATRRRIIDAVMNLFFELYFDQVTLTAVAERAGVTVQTVIQRFGGKDRLIAEALRDMGARVVEQRDEAPRGDVPVAVSNLVEHYEEWGDWVIRLLAQEDRTPDLRRMADSGRTYHHGWVERTFSSLLTGKRGASRKRRLAQLIAATDVYTWKLLRRDQRLDRNQTELAIQELVTGLKGEPQ